MRDEQDKYEVERKVVSDLSNRMGLEIDEGSMRKGDPTMREPDVYCVCAGEGMYFEVAEACAPEFAKAIAEARESDDGVSFARGSDGIEDILRKKLDKRYDVTEPIELVLFTNGRNALPDDVLAPKARSVLSSGLGPFRRIWLCSEGVIELGSTRS